MCRVLIGTSNAIRIYHRLNGFDSLLSHLERECGGQGNGVALHRDGALIEHHKGVELKTKDIADILVRCSKIYDVAVFHTRIASVNVVSDSNCHPFIHGNDSMAMNGTLSEFRDVAQALGITDTEVVFNLIKGLPLAKTVSVLSILEAVFVGMASGKPYVTRNGGSLREWRPKNLPKADFLFASSFPKGTRCVLDLPDCFTFANGKRTGKEASVNSNYYGSYYGSNSWKGTGYSYRTPKSTALDSYEEGYDEGYSAGFEDGYREAAVAEAACHEG